LVTRIHCRHDSTPVIWKVLFIVSRDFLAREANIIDPALMRRQKYEVCRKGNGKPWSEPMRNATEVVYEELLS